MASDEDPVRFVSGNDRLARLLSDPDLRARVDTIVDEMHRIDAVHLEAVRLLRKALIAASADRAEPVDILEALRRHLTEAGARDVGITLTLSDHEVTVPLTQVTELS